MSQQQPHISPRLYQLIKYNLVLLVNSDKGIETGYFKDLNDVFLNNNDTQELVAILEKLDLIECENKQTYFAAPEVYEMLQNGTLEVFVQRHFQVDFDEEEPLNEEDINLTDTEVIDSHSPVKRFNDKYSENRKLFIQAVILIVIIMSFYYWHNQEKDSTGNKTKPPQNININDALLDTPIVTDKGDTMYLRKTQEGKYTLEKN